jgi:hypothetical protein
MRFMTLLAAAALLTAPAAADHHAAGHASDRQAIEQAVDDLYAVISGPVGQERDWEAFRAMYLPNAVMGAVGAGEDGTGRAVTFTPDGYIERSGEFLVRRGFAETATRTEIEIWGEIAYVKSAYEGYVADQEEPLLIGINYITFMKHEGEWKIASILWRQQTEDIPVSAAWE